MSFLLYRNLTDAEAYITAMPVLVPALEEYLIDNNISNVNKFQAIHIPVEERDPDGLLHLQSTHYTLTHEPPTGGCVVTWSELLG